jgi:hypothetical protein
MIIAFLILIGLMVYFIIGRTVINLLEDNDHVDFYAWKGFAVCIFPLVLIWVGIMTGSDYLTDAVDEFFRNLNKYKE